MGDVQYQIKQCLNISDKLKRQRQEGVDMLTAFMKNMYNTYGVIYVDCYKCIGGDEMLEGLTYEDGRVLGYNDSNGYTIEFDDIELEVIIDLLDQIGNKVFHAYDDKREIELEW